MSYNTEIEKLKEIQRRLTTEKDEVDEKISNIEDNDGDIPTEMEDRFNLLEEAWDYLEDAIKALDKLQSL